MTTPITGSNPGSFVAAVPTPDPGGFVKAEDIKETAQALANQNKWQEDDKASQTLGATFTGPGANFDTPVALKTGRILTVENLSEIDAESGSIVRIKSGANLLAASGSFTTGLGRKRRRSRVVLSDGDHTIDTTQGDCFVLHNAPAALRTITLRNSSPLPLANEIIEIIVPYFNVPVAGPGKVYTIVSEGGSEVCSLWDASLNTGAFLQVEFSSVWRLGMNCGWSYDSTGLLAFGVVPGSGA